MWATLEVIALQRTGAYQQRAAELGEHLHAELAVLAAGGAVRAVRGRGLWAGVDVGPVFGTGLADRLMARGVLVKETRGSTLRIAPPPVIEKDELAWGLGQLRGAGRGVALKWTAPARTGGQARRSSWRRRLVLVYNPSTRSCVVL